MLPVVVDVFSWKLLSICIATVFHTTHSLAYSDGYEPVVINHVWILGNAIYTNSSFSDGSKVQDFHGFTINELTSSPTSLGTSAHSGRLIVFNKPRKYPWNWYHNLFDYSLPVFKAVVELGLQSLTPHEVTVVFANNETQLNGIIESQAFLSSFWQHHYNNVYLTTQAFLHAQQQQHLRQDANQPVLYYPTAVFIGSNVFPAWPNFGDRTPYMEALQFMRSRTAERLSGDDAPSQDVVSNPEHQSFLTPVEPSQMQFANRDPLWLEGPDRPADGKFDVVVLLRHKAGGGRAFLNDMSDFETALKEAGITSYLITELIAKEPFSVHWKLFAHAKVIVAAHGAAVTNVAWMQAGTAVIEIFPWMWQYDLYKSWAHMLDVRYFDLFSTLPATAEHLTQASVQEWDCVPYRELQISVDVPVLIETLQNALNQSYQPSCLKLPWTTVTGYLFHCQ